MEVLIKTGDLLDEWADVLISTANPQLNMSGGVNGEILLRGGQDIQEELREYLRELGEPNVEPGTVIQTTAGPTNAAHILHAVAIDAFYGWNVELVEKTIERAFQKASELGALTVAMPALATGYSPLTINDFAQALAGATRSFHGPLERLIVVLRRSEDAKTVRRVLAEHDRDDK